MQRIYFDHNATAPLNIKVQNNMIKLMNQPLNPSSVHEEGRYARKILETARKEILNKLSVADSHRLIFTSSCTEANNLVLTNFSAHQKICCKFEHPSVKNLISQQNIELDTNGIIDVKKLEKYLDQHHEKPIIISVMYANNEIGSIQPIHEIIGLAKKFNCLLHCDITQAIGRIPIAISNIDLITLSAHKCGGPVGAAALLSKKELNLKPLILGGGQEFGLRSGTQNLVAIHGLHTAFTIIEEITTEFAKLSLLRDYLESKLSKISQQVVIAAKDSPRLPNTSSIHMPGVTSETQLIFFDMHGFAVSAGSACSVGKIDTSATHLAMGIKKEIAQNFIRISLGTNCSKEQINLFIKYWHDLYKSNN
jgi:cysteine desulfurase